MMNIVLILIIGLVVTGCAKKKDSYYNTQMKGIKASYQEGRIDEYQYEILKQRAKDTKSSHRTRQ